LALPVGLSEAVRRLLKPFWFFTASFCTARRTSPYKGVSLVEFFYLVAELCTFSLPNTKDLPSSGQRLQLHGNCCFSFRVEIIADIKN